MPASRTLICFLGGENRCRRRPLRRRPCRTMETAKGRTRLNTLPGARGQEHIELYASLFHRDTNQRPRD